MLGVTIGVILLILLIGLVVLQGAIEWGGFDSSKKANEKEEKPKKQVKQTKVMVKPAKKTNRKGKK